MAAMLFGLKWKGLEDLAIPLLTALAWKSINGISRKMKLLAQCGVLPVVIPSGGRVSVSSREKRRMTEALFKSTKKAEVLSSAFKKYLTSV